MKNVLLVIVGPTAVGKTELCLDLAQHYSTEIISSDSRQVYKELKIGTAAPTSLQLNRVKHHFIGTQSIHDYYNASMFENDVLELLSELFTSKPVVIMTGGSGLYVNAVCEGIDDLPTIDPGIRQNLIEKHETEGIESLRVMLKRLDPDYYEKADLKNPKRILKGLEVSLMTGKPYSSFLNNEKKKRYFQIIKAGLNIERNLLYERINQRVDEMIENGLVEEAKENFRYKNLNSLNTLGYKELFAYFEGKYDLERAIELIKRNTRHYARRQISWFNRDKEIVWFSPSEREKIIEHVEQQMQNG